MIGRIEEQPVMINIYEVNLIYPKYKLVNLVTFPASGELALMPLHTGLFNYPGRERKFWYCT